MITIDTLNVYGFKEAVHGLRQSYNSHDLSDSVEDELGKNDLELMSKLSKKGGSHAKFRRMIVVYVDIKAPLYWWKQFDTYKVGTVTCSTSTMHNIQDKRFDIGDFSFEYLEESMLGTIDVLNYNREKYRQTGDKIYWWKMIQTLPSSYNQLRTVMLNYETLARIYSDRLYHPLDEWKTFCSWIYNCLPYGRQLILGDNTEKLTATAGQAMTQGLIQGIVKTQTKNSDLREALTAIQSANDICRTVFGDEQK